MSVSTVWDVLTFILGSQRVYDLPFLQGLWPSQDGRWQWAAFFKSPRSGASAGEGVMPSGSSSLLISLGTLVLLNWL